MARDPDVGENATVRYSFKTDSKVRSFAEDVPRKLFECMWPWLRQMNKNSKFYDFTIFNIFWCSLTFEIMKSLGKLHNNSHRYINMGVKGFWGTISYCLESCSVCTNEKYSSHFAIISCLTWWMCNFCPMKYKFDLKYTYFETTCSYTF